MHFKKIFLLITGDSDEICLYTAVRMFFHDYSNSMRESLLLIRDNTIMPTTAMLRGKLPLSIAFDILIKWTGIYGGIAKMQNTQQEVQLYQQKI